MEISTNVAKDDDRKDGYADVKKINPEDLKEKLLDNVVGFRCQKRELTAYRRDIIKLYEEMFGAQKRSIAKWLDEHKKGKM